MAAEEDFLKTKFHEEFQGWAANTPAFFPKPSLWKSTQLPFSFRAVLKREYTGLLVVVSLHTGVQVIKQHLLVRHPLVEPFWGIAFSAAVIIYVALRTIKKHTQVLSVPGR